MSDHKQQVLSAIEAACAHIESEDWHGECVCQKRTAGRCFCQESHDKLLRQLDDALKLLNDS